MIASKLKRIACERGVSFKEPLNTSVRRGMRSAEAPRPYRVAARRLGVKPGVGLDRALRIAAEMEDAETLRKLALRK